MKSRLMIPLLMIVAMAGCASSGTDFEWDDVERVESGMTPTQVRLLLGNPNMVTKTQDADGQMIETWVWSYAKVGFMGSSSEAKSVAINFKEGVVIGIPHQSTLDMSPDEVEEPDPSDLR